MKPATSTMTVLKQVLDPIPACLVPTLGRKHGVAKQSRCDHRLAKPICRDSPPDPWDSSCAER